MVLGGPQVVRLDPARPGALALDKDIAVRNKGICALGHGQIGRQQSSPEALASQLYTEVVKTACLCHFIPGYNVILFPTTKHGSHHRASLPKYTSLAYSFLYLSFCYLLVPLMYILK